LPLNVQLPVAPKLTLNWEEAVALTVKSASPKVLSTKLPNVIVWFAFTTLIDEHLSFTPGFSL
jgi:hypothetical protein